MRRVCCWLWDVFEEAGISCSLVALVCGGDHGSLFLYYSHWVRLVKCESLWGVVTFYDDCITHPDIIGFHLHFSISVSLYCSLGFGVTLPKYCAMYYVQVGFFPFFIHYFLFDFLLRTFFYWWMVHVCGSERFTESSLSSVAVNNGLHC